MTPQTSNFINHEDIRCRILAQERRLNFFFRRNSIEHTFAMDSAVVMGEGEKNAKQRRLAFRLMAIFAIT